MARDSRDVGLADQSRRCGFPRRQPHVRLRGVGTLGDDLGGGVSVASPMQFVLRRGVEVQRDRRIFVVVDARRVDVGDLMIEAALARTDRTDPRQQIVEIVGPETVAGDELLVVDREALRQVVAERGCSPLAELGSAGSADAIPHGNDHVEGVVVHEPFDRPGTLGLNYPEFPDSCLRRQFALGKAVVTVFVDRPDVFLEQLGDVPLRQPKRLVLDPQHGIGGSLFKESS